MITIQELHAYNRLVEKGVAPAVTCPIDPLDGSMIPWSNENDEPCFWCLACNAKSYLGLNQINYIKSLLHQ